MEEKHHTGPDLLSSRLWCEKEKKSAFFNQLLFWVSVIHSSIEPKPTTDTTSGTYGLGYTVKNPGLVLGSEETFARKLCIAVTGRVFWPGEDRWQGLFREKEGGRNLGMFGEAWGPSVRWGFLL